MRGQRDVDVIGLQIASQSNWWVADSREALSLNQGGQLLKSNIGRCILHMYLQGHGLPCTQQDEVHKNRKEETKEGTKEGKRNKGRKQWRKERRNKQMKRWRQGRIEPAMEMQGIIFKREKYLILVPGWEQQINILSLVTRSKSCRRY